jgi:hypothetical protein
MRRIPGWLLGGLIGAGYFVVTFLAEFSSPGCQFTARDMCGAFTAIMNFPAVAIWGFAHLPWFPLDYTSPASVILNAVPYMAIDFGIGAALGWLIARRRKRA